MLKLSTRPTRARAKYLMPIGPSRRRVTSIHREARERMERVQRDLEALRKEDPWVFAALLDVAQHRGRFGAYQNGAFARRDVRERAHELKVRSVEAARPAIAAKRVSRTRRQGGGAA